MKNKVLYSFSNNIYSHCEIENKYGFFEEKAYVSDEDLDIANKWDGGRICEYRITIKTLKAKYKVMKERANGIKHACNVLRDNPHTDDLTVAMFERQASIAEREANKVKAQYQNMEENFDTFVEQLQNNRREARARVQDSLS